MSRPGASRVALLFVLLALAGCSQVSVAEPTQAPLITVGLPSPDGQPTASGQPSASVIPLLTPTPVASPSEAVPPSPTASPSVAATPAPATPLPSGGASTNCVNGWSTPAAGSSLYAEGLSVIEGQMGVQGPWQVAEMRYFSGPDVPWIEPQRPLVERWYIKAALADQAGFRGRWLVEKRTPLIEGISAVAPWDTHGYQSPDWTAFEGEGKPVTYIGLPGEWAGIPYDFVTGAGDSGQPGLPDQVSGCLGGT
jgi:hypothetical protein